MSRRSSPARAGNTDEPRGPKLVSEVETELAALTLNRKHAALFPEPTDMRGSLKALREDLAEVLVLGKGGKVTSVHEKIMDDGLLSKAQKDRILRVLAEVRDSYLRIDKAIADGGANKGYQIVNWKHTRAEIDQVLDATRLAKLTAAETEDALLASIFSDSVKTPQNFIVHNVDGAAAAGLVLQRYFDANATKTLQRLAGICQAAKEHQIGPPGFMATMAKGILGRKLKELGRDGGALADSIQYKIAHPFDKAHLVPDGSEIVFTPAEKELLALIDVHEWTVPHEGSSWYHASRAVIDGDSLINYASPDGWAKIAALRGPDTMPFFEDATVFDSLRSTKLSYDDAMNVISEPAKPLAEAGLERTRGAIKRMRDHMMEHFKALGPLMPMNPDGVPFNADGTIAFWDAPLRYPSKGALNALEKAQFKFAKHIREKVVELLRAEQGVY